MGDSDEEFNYHRTVLSFVKFFWDGASTVCPLLLKGKLELDRGGRAANTDVNTLSFCADTFRVLLGELLEMNFNRFE